MSTLSLRLPDSLYETALALAKREHVSVDQLISTAVAEKISALMTEDYLEGRAKRGKREDYDAVLAKVPDVEPDEGDGF